MRVTKTTAFMMLFLSGCLVQEPAPVSLRGEEFHGVEELLEDSNYHLIREYTADSTRSRAITEHDSKLLISEISPDYPNTACDFTMPLDGAVVTSRFKHNSSNQRCSDGVTIVDNKHINLVGASSSGQVLYIGRGLRGYGNLVILEHNKYTVSMYYNLGDIRVKIGDEVKKGDIIATVLNNDAAKASPGTNSFCFSVRKNGKSVNPIQHIKKCGGK